ncbi:hypothetical protein BU15DRAFT_71237 [Melanogaster broomeanus]|nr:hypothetical protein BU15DRAFT_71237 [Melanogaster broomeanus]
MDQFRKMFKMPGTEGDIRRLKHAKSMPLRSKSKSGREQGTDPNKPVYRGKAPLRPSDIVYVKHNVGVNEISRDSQEGLSHPGYHDPYYDILDKFPAPPAPPPVPPRSPLRTRSVNKCDEASYVMEATLNCLPRFIRKPPSVLHRREFPIHGAVVIPEPPIEDNFPVISSNAILGSHTPRQAERMRAQSQSSPSPAAHPTHGQALNWNHSRLHPSNTHPPLSRSAAHTSRSNLRQPPPISLRSRTHSGDSRGGPHVGDALDHIERERARKLIAASPSSPPVPVNAPFALRPIYFDMQDPHCLKMGLNYHLHLAIGTGRPLDARYYQGGYHRLVEASVPEGLVPEVGTKWSNDFLPSASCACTTSLIERRK